jgi:hypothetical protein
LPELIRPHGQLGRVYLLWLPVQTNPLPLLRELTKLILLLTMSLSNNDGSWAQRTCSGISQSGGAASATSPGQPIMGAPPGTHRDGASTSPRTHCTEPSMEATAAPFNPTIIVAHKRTTPMDQATVPPVINPPSRNPFKELATDAAGGGDTDNDTTVLDDGLLQPLLNGATPPDVVAPPGALAVDDPPPPPRFFPSLPPPQLHYLMVQLPLLTMLTPRSILWST